MRRISVSRARILFGRLAKILVLQKQTGKLIVDGCRISLLREGLEVSAVPLACLAIIRELVVDRKSTRLNSSHVSISYAVFCLKKKRRQHYISVEQRGAEQSDC